MFNLPSLFGAIVAISVVFAPLFVAILPVSTYINNFICSNVPPN
jgi:hypothetical protein